MIASMAILAAGLAGLVLAGGRPALLAVRLGSAVPSGSVARPDVTVLIRWLGGRTAAVVIAIACGAGGLALLGPGGLVLGVAAVPVSRLWWLRRTRAQARRRCERDVEEACVALAGELGSGVSARDALAGVAHDWPVLFGAASGQALLGGDPAPAMRNAAHQPGAEALRSVAAAWEVSERTGASLAAVLTTVADTVRADAAVRREADTHLSSVRTTARLMAALPVLTLAAFSAGDGAAVTFLTRTPPGVVCLTAAVGCIAVGLFWVDRMTRSIRPVWLG